MGLWWGLLHNVVPGLPPWTHSTVPYDNCWRDSRVGWGARIRGGVGLGPVALLGLPPLVRDEEHPETPYLLEIAVPYVDLRVIGMVSAV